MSPDAVRDGRVRAWPRTDAVWWTEPRRAGQPVALEFDLGRERAIHWIDMRLAGDAGFSRHFNLCDYAWQVRDWAGAAWREVARIEGNRDGAVRHVLTLPVSARWWRLEIPTSENPDEAALIRVAEIQMWAPE